MMIKLLFFAEIIIMIVVSSMLTKTTVSEKISGENISAGKIILKKLNSSKTDIFVNICTVFALLIGIADITGLLKTGILHGGFVVIGAVLLIERICSIIRTIIPSGTIKFFGKMLAITALIELIVFQMPSYRIFFGDYKHSLLTTSQGTVTSENTEIEAETGNLTVSGTADSAIEFLDIGKKVGTVRVNVASSSVSPHRLKVNVDIADDTSSVYRNGIVTAEIVPENESTSYITFLLSGDVEKLQFHFSGEENSDFFTIASIELNAPVPFEISVLRMLIILIVSTLAYAIIFSAFLNKEYRKNKTFCNLTSYIITVTAVLIAVGMTIARIPADSEDYFKQKSGNQISEELVLAFENKQVSLLQEPSERLLEMEDPYDSNLRSAENVYTAWDHVFYNGKYYSYYGIAPVILLFLPYHMITEYFFPTDIAVMIFAVIGIIFLVLTYNAIIKRWFRNIPSGCYIAGLIMIMTVCGIWFSVGRPLFYEISISSGFAFVTLGAYFLISSNVISKGKTSLPKVTLASLFLATAVLCRPTLAVYSICACVYYAIGFSKSAEVKDEEGIVQIKKKRRIAYLVCALIPFVVLGLVQMIYNYVRFGSPLDFGIQYSLTINDFVDAEYHTLFMLIGLFGYLFQFPTIKADYPYVETWFTYFRANGYYFKDSGQTSGIVWLALPVFAYLLTGKALKRLPDRKSRLWSIAVIGLPCVIMPVVIICSIWESGYAVRYVADFSWQILMGALAVLFFLYQTSKNTTLKKLFKYFMAFSLVASLIVNIPQIFTFAFAEYDYPIITSKFHELIEFWR
ncbi:MAG: hypothetical protein NC177_01815 [Ruminococcus flavefaciens]|nr:hypothetical protein [Ruminococcus flavefaciens]